VGIHGRGTKGIGTPLPTPTFAWACVPADSTAATAARGG